QNNMSHTVHPYAHRLGILRDWKSRWFGVGQKYRQFLKGDVLIRQFLEKKLLDFYVADIEIERSKKAIRIIIKTSRPGMIIGRNGEGMDKLRKQLASFMIKNGIHDEAIETKIEVYEVRSSESNARLV